MKSEFFSPQFIAEERKEMMIERIEKMNKDMMAVWDKLYGDMMIPQMDELQSLWEANWNRWFETVRFSYEMGVSNWNKIMEQSLDVWFKSYQKSKNYSESVEGQIRQSWESLKKTQHGQEEKTREILGNINTIISREERRMAPAPERPHA
jgi:hypothetical protein